MKANPSRRLNATCKPERQTRREFQRKVWQGIGALAFLSMTSPLRAAHALIPASLPKSAILPSPFKYDIEADKLANFDQHSFYGKVKEVRDRHWWRFCFSFSYSDRHGSASLRFNTLFHVPVVILTSFASGAVGWFLGWIGFDRIKEDPDTPKLIKENPEASGAVLGGLAGLSGAQYAARFQSRGFTQEQYYESSAKERWVLYQQMDELKDLVDEVIEARDFLHILGSPEEMRESGNAYLVKLANLPELTAQEHLKSYRQALEQGVYSALVLLAQRAGELPAARMPNQSEVDGQREYIKVLRTEVWQAQESLDWARFQIR